MKKVGIILLFLCMASIKAQSIYIDPVTTAAMLAYSENLKSQQNKTNDEQKKLKEIKVFISAQLEVANTYQKKVYKGLREVDGTVVNGLQVKDIYDDLKWSYKYLEDISKLVKEHPQYSVFGIKSSEEAYQSVLEMTARVKQVLKEDDTNLMLAGDRYQLLDEISIRVKVIRERLFGIRWNIERAARLGFWKAINPFSAYINTDKSIVQGIMGKLKDQY